MMHVVWVRGMNSYAVHKMQSSWKVVKMSENVPTRREKTELSRSCNRCSNTCNNTCDHIESLKDKLFQYVTSKKELR